MSDAPQSATTPEKTSPAKNHVKGHFLIPSPIITRRTRTQSMSKFAADGPVKKGEIIEFERSKGHGFIQPSEEGADKIFVHISDIEGEYVPVHGDLVTYKECPIPPKKDKVQAVDVQLTHLNPESKHVRWGMAGSS
ncbi:calcium-regulated heat-stable protein 1-like [Diadema antillarum]|uniref:calcium-regulated heat-stable protein 1-like n=1 Tax=Diadema antillarum TaxID=105358 RepID=UPI003A89F54A